MMLARQGMLDRFDRPTRRLTSALALVLCVAVSRPVHGVGPQPELEPMLLEADEHASAGRHDAALRAYADAFEIMPAETRASDVGEFVALAAGHAAVADYKARGKRESLEIGRRVIVGFIASVAAAGPDARTAPVDAARQQLSEIEGLMPTEVMPPVEDAGVDREDPKAEPGPEVQADAEDPTTGTNPGKLRGMGKAGMALVVVGGLGAITGVTLVVLPPKTFPTGHPNAAFIQTTRPPGWGVLAGGVAALVAGAALLGLDRTQAKQRAAAGASPTKPQARVQPWLGRDGAGLGIAGRF
jgi:hypothetical protein